MKLRIFSLFAAFLLFVASLFTESFVKVFIPSVELTKPKITGYTRSINCSGEIMEKNREDVYLSVPIIASEVFFSVGDRVEKGDIIASVDKAATAAAIISSYTSGFNEAMYEAALKLSKDELSEATAIFGNSMSLSQNLKSIPNYIRAGISGTITKMELSCNKPSSAYAPVVTIIDDSTLVAKVAVSENNINYISVGASAVLRGSAFGNTEYDALVSEIYPSAYKKYSALSSETVVDVILTPVSSTHKLKAGYTTKASIIVSDNCSAVTVPYESVMQDEENREYVLVYSNGRAVKQYITTGLELSQGFEVLDGISDGTQIIKDPSKIAENSLVRVIADED